MKKDMKNALMGQVISMEPIQGSMKPKQTKPKKKAKQKQTPSFYWTWEGGELVRRQRPW